MMSIIPTVVAITENEVNLPTGNLEKGNIDNVLKLVFAFAGAIAVLIITIAALQYVASAGNPQSTAKAKDTIMYALIGLVICITGFSIVTFVLGRV